MKEEEKYQRLVGAGAVEVRPPIPAGREERWRQGGSRKYTPSKLGQEKWKQRKISIPDFLSDPKINRSL